MQVQTLLMKDIPFYTQKVDITTYEQDGFVTYEEALSWEKRGCGIASLRMVIDGFQKEQRKPLCPGHGAMIHKGLEKNAYKENVGWIHQGLADMAAEFGILGTAYRGQAVGAIVQKLEEGKPCIASVTPRFLGGQLNEEGGFWTTGGHLIVVIGTVKEDGVLKALIVHHPSCFLEYNWAARTVNVAEFTASFSGNFIAFQEII